MSLFTGSGVAIITPFDDSGVNLACYEKLIDRQINQGTDAIIALGTTGEPSTMTESEKKEAIACAINVAAGRVPVIVGTGGNNTAKVIADSKRAQEMGADGLLVVTPYYNKCTADGLVAHYTAVAESVDLPIIVYNVPGRTGVNILPDTMKRLAGVSNIVGIKEASANIEQITEIARLCPEIDLYSGNDDHVLPILALGGKGVISVVANVCPKEMHDLCAAWFEGDIARCRALQFMLNPLTKLLFSEVNPIPVKAAMNMLGFDAGIPRLPLTPLSAANAEKLSDKLRSMGMLG
ncbi:MAG: 4-hydroxy-tetrahydrodipicolinate synthase [Christensenellales bacterium]|jgi:4-hydroxy-tetrahydrodipicolinate synthase